mmetsp:Transcript_31689/g.43471  ORF Transcript_31689/g.43471 Transcript_31689/m.43471 type:complete len:1213 (+) Transcript_31689:256-3894(+)
MKRWTYSSTDKPPSNPYNWPKSTPEDIRERPQRIVKIGEPQTFYFCNNFVKTSKYEAWNFIPKFLLEEFNPKTKIANCYFLVISGLQCIPQISNTGGIPTTLIPLFIVVVIDGIFQIFEDISRHRADTAANASLADRLSKASHSFEKCHWWELEVGDFIKIPSRGQIPADVVIIAVAEKPDSPAQGVCYVETKSLDGETNLKIRNALPNTYAKIQNAEQLVTLVGEVEMEHPNKLIDSFTGVIDFGKTLGREPIPANCVLLRGCVLRNTDWAIGLVVNTGHDTKIMMSSSGTRAKTSQLESLASQEIIRIIYLLAIVCVAGATGQAIWNALNKVEDMWYLKWNQNAIAFWFIDFFYFFLLHATFIPVSLYVSMSVVRYVQAYFMNNDLSMYYAHTDTPALVRTMTLNEELGQISHIFSDKTGTLTCNVMDFRKASINGVSYGEGITEIGRAAWKLQNRPIPQAMLDSEVKARLNAVPHVSFYCPKYEIHSTGGAGQLQQEKIRQFYRVISICHDVIPERVDGQLRLSASNPDDEALVCAATYFGFEFWDRRENFTIIKNKHLNKEEEIEVLMVIPFTSKRKRMSVVIRDPADNQIKLLTKGADAVMFGRLRTNQDFLVDRTDQDMREYAIEGLRCLLIGFAVILEDDFRSWHKEYRKAITDISQIERKKRGESNSIEDMEERLEQGLTLLGCTAIEDKLQDGVPDCIAQLARAGINLWVLTGDKEETAINIAVACNLLQPSEYMDHIIVNNTTAPDVAGMKTLFTTEIERYNKEDDNEGFNSDPMKPRALIIDGPSLLVAMADMQPRGLRELLLEVSQLCKAVVACRVSPDQKRQMVHLVKTGVADVRTLAIGDGANDVAMIQEAHIGVGIKGEEGLQAVNSADYAIAQFRYLSDLTLKHGRYNYIRMSSLVCYMFYKNILMSVAQFWFNFNCAFSGQKYYTEGAIQLFNLAYTSIPILFLGFYDMDISPDTVFLNPETYLAGINNEYFKTSLFWMWILSAVMESIILSVLPLFTLQNFSVVTGQLSQFYEPGMTCFTAIIFAANIKLFFMQSRWYWFNYLILVLTLLFFFATLFLITSVQALDSNFYQVWTRMTASGTFWLNLLMLLTIVVGKDIYVSGLERNFNFRPPHILQELEVGNHLETRVTNFMSSRLSIKSGGRRAVADSHVTDNNSGGNSSKVGFVPVEGAEVEMTARNGRSAPGRVSPKDSLI